MKWLYVLLLGFAMQVSANDTIYQMEYATIDKDGVKDGEVFFKINEQWLMPTTCAYRNKIFIDTSTAAGVIAHGMVFDMKTHNWPAELISFKRYPSGKCYLYNLIRRDVANSDYFDPESIYLREILVNRQFEAFGCPDPFRVPGEVGYEFQTQSPEQAQYGDWSMTYGGHMEQYLGTTCRSTDILGISVPNNYRMRWRITYASGTSDAYKSLWTEIIARDTL